MCDFFYFFIWCIIHLFEIEKIYNFCEFIERSNFSLAIILNNIENL